MTEKLSALEGNQTITLPHISNAITESGKEILGFKEPNCKRGKPSDQLNQMSLEHKQRLVKIRNTTDIEKMKELKQKRNNILKNITEIVNKIKEERIGAILDELQSVSDGRRC